MAQTKKTPNFLFVHISSVAFWCCWRCCCYLVFAHSGHSESVFKVANVCSGQWVVVVGFLLLPTMSCDTGWSCCPCQCALHTHIRRIIVSFLSRRNWRRPASQPATSVQLVPVFDDEAYLQQTGTRCASQHVVGFFCLCVCSGGRSFSASSSGSSSSNNSRSTHLSDLCCPLASSAISARCHWQLNASESKSGRDNDGKMFLNYTVWARHQQAACCTDFAQRVRAFNVINGFGIISFLLICGALRFITQLEVAGDALDHL